MLSQIHQIWSRLKRSLSGGDRRRLELISLDDWTLLELLDRIPLVDLLRLGQTNHRLRDLIQCNYLYSSPKRRAICLVIGTGFCNNEHLNPIQVPQLTRLVIENLLQQLPHITSLELIFNVTENIELLFILLHHYANQLKFLAIGVPKTLDWSSYSIGPLIKLINQMPHLKGLQLKYKNRLPAKQWRQHLRLPILRQLETFEFFTYNNATRVLRQLMRHADVSKMRYIELTSSFLTPQAARLLLDLEPQLAAKFESLKLIFTQLGFNQLCSLFRHYPNLIRVKLIYVYLTIGQLNVALQLLPKLVDLYLIVNFSVRSLYRERPDASMLLGEEIQPDTIDPRELVPLTSVTTLYIDFALRTHDDFSTLYLGVLYPNITSIHFINITCGTCGYPEDDDDEKIPLKFDCIRKLLMQEEKRFTKLKKVVYQGYRFQYDDLLSPDAPPPSKLKLYRCVILTWFFCFFCLLVFLGFYLPFDEMFSVK